MFKELSFVNVHDIHDVLFQAAMIVGETKNPDDVDFNDVLCSFMAMEKCGFHHRAARYKRKFPGMPFGVYPYSGKYGDGYIVTHTGGMDYYLKGVEPNEKHFYRFR
jgi:hypothetical protein